LIAWGQVLAQYLHHCGAQFAASDTPAGCASSRKHRKHLSEENVMPISRSALLVGAMLAVTGIAEAQDAEDIIKYRQGVMKSVGGHMAAAGLVVQGKVNFSDDLSQHAESIARSLSKAEALFPKGSDFGETRALEVVWKKPDDFKKVATRGGAAAAEFAKAVKVGDKAAMGAKFKDLGDACKACHKDYRKEEN
jgi:cytochrome c556